MQHDNGSLIVRTALSNFLADMRAFSRRDMLAPQTQRFGNVLSMHVALVRCHEMLASLSRTNWGYTNWRQRMQLTEREESMLMFFDDTVEFFNSMPLHSCRNADSVASQREWAAAYIHDNFNMQPASFDWDDAFGSTGQIG